ncbi:E3 ubiquitin-protein ligase LRSAM1-like isoform X2 [Mya arenaria]|nr:E3 ubiquitin-protein ligase LRSAM1-like isoform X2 [Mya arenaria]
MGSRGSRESPDKHSRDSFPSTSQEISSDDETDGDLSLSTKPKRGSKKGSKKNKKKMPLFRSRSEKAKKRQHHQQYLAQENPEPVFDLSHCELEEIPSGVFAVCKVLHKEVLLLNDNWLTDVHGGGEISSLLSIRVLDLHNNEIRSVPKEIAELQSLQVLNLENNKLKRIPSTIGQLKCLQTLNVKGNHLKELPDSVCELKSLRNLDIRENLVTALPKHLCRVRTLETLSLDDFAMKYPPQDICTSGTEDVMKYLCSECGMEYLPPSNFLLDVLDPPKIPLTSPATEKALKEEENMMRSLAGYSDMVEKRREALIEVERSFAEHQEAQAQLALMAQMNHEQMVSMIAEEENRMDQELDKLSREKEDSRKRLVKDLQAVEKGADNLIQSLLDINAKAKKTEELLDQIEEQRIKDDKLFEVRWEEIQNLRKKDVLGNMQSLLQETEFFESVVQKYLREKEDFLQNALENDEMMANAQIASVLDHNDKQLSLLISDLAKQEELQREAFEALQLQKDVKHQRIRNQIALIQDELASLTVVEIEKRDHRMEQEMNRLAEKRIMLIELLSQLMEEQDNRQIELRKRLDEMEQQREDGQADYWLVQFQRLMDQKPQSLIDREQNLEISVVKILNKAHAEDFIRIFARHRITIETMLTLSDEDLKLMGIHELGVRREILRNIEEYRDTKLSLKVKSVESGDFSVPRPTAPPLEAQASRQMSVVARGLNSECSICMDSASDVIFMNCGHVCTCSKCCEKVQECPLCRAPIVRRVKVLAAQV